MIIKEVMKQVLTTVSPATTLTDAYTLMQNSNIRHLPVVENNKLVGIVTDRDLRLSTSKLAKHPFEPNEAIGNIMSQPVKTTHPSDPIESAAKLMRELKIGCLPVVEEQRLIGIVTITDMLDALLLLTGITQPSGRLDVRLKNRTGELAKLAMLLAEYKVNIHSILTYPEKDKTIRLVLRIGTIEIKLIAKAICNAGFEVVWPTQLACAK